MKRIWLWLALQFVGTGASAQSYVVDFFNESTATPTTPIALFQLPPPWSTESQSVPGAIVGANASYARLAIRVRNGVAPLSGVSVSRSSCGQVGANGVIAGTGANPNATTDGLGKARFDLVARDLVTPNSPARELTCNYVVSFPNGTLGTYSIAFRGTDYVPVELSFLPSALTTASVYSEGPIQVLAKHQTQWLPSAFSGTPNAAGRTLESTCTMTNAPSTTGSVVFASATNGTGTVTGVVASKNLNVMSPQPVRSGTCSIKLATGSPGASLTTPISLSILGSQWVLSALNTNNLFDLGVRGGPVSFRVLLNGQGQAPGIGQTVRPTSASACATTLSGTSLSAVGNTPNVLTSYVTGGSSLVVNGPINVPNQSVTGNCRFQLDNHQDVFVDVGVRGADICSDTTVQPRHSACTTGASKQVLVIDQTSIDGATGTYQGIVSLNASGQATQACSASRCVFEYPANSTVTVTASGLAGSGVASWEYDCTADYPARTSSVTVNMDQLRHCAIQWGPRASSTDMIGACPANYGSQIYRFDWKPSQNVNRCVTSLEAFEANIRAGSAVSGNAETFAMAFPAILPNVLPDGRVQVRMGLDYRGRSGDYLTPDITPPGYNVRRPLVVDPPKTTAELKYNNWPSTAMVALANAGCAAGASPFGFNCKNWTDELARFEAARRASGWCVLQRTAPVGTGVSSARIVRVPSPSLPGASVRTGIVTTQASQPGTFTWGACAPARTGAQVTAAAVPPDTAESAGGKSSGSVSCAEGSVPDANGNCSTGDAGKLLTDEPNSPPLTQEPECTRGNPCGPGTGNKSVDEMDFNYGALGLARHYTAKRQLRTYSGLGLNWSHNYSWRLLTPHFLPAHNSYQATATAAFVFFQNEKAQLETFRKISTGVFRSEKTVGLILRHQPASASWILFYPDGHQLHINTLGLPAQLVYPEDPANSLSFVHGPYDELVSVQDGRGRTLQFVYEAPAVVNGVPLGQRFNANLESVRLQGIEQVRFEYDELDRLTFARYPGGKFRQYKYAETGYADPMFRFHITGIINERGERYASYKYDAMGRVIDSYHGDMLANRVQLNYVSDEEVRVTTAIGVGQSYQETFNFNDPLFRKPSGLSDPRGSTTNVFNYEDSTQCATTGSPDWLCQQIDPRNIKTRLRYDQFHLTRVEEDVRAPNTAQCNSSTECIARVVTSTWNDAINRIRTKENDGRKVETVYDSLGRVSSITTSDTRATVTLAAPRALARTTTYRYCDAADVSNTATGCPFVGYLKSIDGPRTDVNDVMALRYYTGPETAGCSNPASGLCALKGDLKRIENALGHSVEFKNYNTFGQVLRTQDANGVVTANTYNARGWMETTRTFNPANPSISALQQMVYNDNGSVQSMTDADGVKLSFSYDTAERLKLITDLAGNRIEFELDAKGNRISEKYLGDRGQVRRILARQFDQLGRVQAIVRAPFALNPNAVGAKKLSFTYDAANNLDASTDELGTVTKHQYDGLERLTEVINDFGGTDPGTANAKSAMAYDANDNLLHVIDPMNLVTTYDYDGLNNGRTENSPDTKKSSMSFDAAGNLISKTDARGSVATFVYDALDRVSVVSYLDPTQGTMPGEAYFYDEFSAITGCTESYPVGRLTRMQDQSGITTYCYDWRGNVTRKTQSSNRNRTHTLEYSYSLADRLASITYPSGTIVSYGRNNLGQTTTVTASLNGVQKTIVGAATYEPFGPLNWMRFGSTDTITRVFNQNYQPTQIARNSGLGALQSSLDYVYDDIGRVSQLTQSSISASSTQYFSYDRLHRLTEARSNAAPGSGVIEQYTYDLIGNRLSAKDGPGPATPYRYNNQASQPVFPSNPNYANKSHRLNGFGNVDSRYYDASGNLTSRDYLGLAYNARGELVSTEAAPCLGGAKICYGASRYHFNAAGERVGTTTGYSLQSSGETESLSKASPQTRYEDFAMFDESGQLLMTEQLNVTNVPCGSCRNPYVEYVYLDGVPIASLNDPTGPTGMSISEVFSDNLGTPRASTEALNTTWTWNALGSASGGNSFGQALAQGHANSLRFPGQQYDAQTGLHYNYMRFYEPKTGRYISSDPIGLMGGAATYAYAGSNPISNSDRSGLFFTSVDAACTIDPSLCFEILGSISDANAALATDPDKKAYWQAVSGLTCNTANVAEKVAIVSAVAAATKLAAKLAKWAALKNAERLAALEAKRAAAEAYRKLDLPPYYRGVGPEHPGATTFEDAKRGIATVGNPNGTITPLQHNFGNVGANSPYSSWTADINVARAFAGPDGVVLVAPRNTGLPWVGSTNAADPSEMETLLKGNHAGFMVIPAHQIPQL